MDEQNKGQELRGRLTVARGESFMDRWGIPHTRLTLDAGFRSIADGGGVVSAEVVVAGLPSCPVLGGQYEVTIRKVESK